MKVVISQKVPESGLALLQEKRYNLVYLDQEYPLDSEELIEYCKDAEGLWCLLSDRIDKEFISSCPNLKIIANYAVGFENIDLVATRGQGITVSNTPVVLSNATADLAFTLLLSVARNVISGHNYMLSGEFDGWKSTRFLGSDISGKTLGILGAGRIGSKVAKRGLGFDMDVIYHSLSSKPQLDALGCTFVDFETILAQSDFLSLHLPVTDETKLILNIKTMRRMKKGAYLINTGRGKLVDEQALVYMLKEGHLGGAGLDVYELEPDLHPELTQLNNVVLLPHIGSATTETRDKMAELCATAIIDVFEGRVPPNKID